MESSNITIATLKRMFSEGKRFDGRGLLDLRDIKIEYEVSNKAEGSARVRMGKTEVIVGVKLAPGTPYPDSKDKGNLVVSGDLLPLASPRFQAGPPEFEAIELPRLVDREVRESKMIKLNELVIKEGEKVWTVYIDIYPINDDGNLIDASSIATLCALRNTMVPETDAEGNIDYDKEATKKLPLVEGLNPVSFSFFKLGNSYILDPTREEQEACESRVTFGISKGKTDYLIHSCQKSGVTTMSQSDIDKMMDVLPKKYDEVSEKLKSFL
jgi:exosome complex component RRP42